MVIDFRSGHLKCLNREGGKGQFRVKVVIVGQFGTGQFGTKIIKGTIWHQDNKSGQFGTRTIWHQDNLAPDILAPGQFGTKHLI